MYGCLCDSIQTNIHTSTYLYSIYASTFTTFLDILKDDSLKQHEIADIIMSKYKGININFNSYEIY